MRNREQVPIQGSGKAISRTATKKLTFKTRPIHRSKQPTAVVGDCIGQPLIRTIRSCALGDGGLVKHCSIRSEHWSGESRDVSTSRS